MPRVEFSSRGGGSSPTDYLLNTGRQNCFVILLSLEPCHSAHLLQMDVSRVKVGDSWRRSRKDREGKTRPAHPCIWSLELGKHSLEKKEAFPTSSLGCDPQDTCPALPEGVSAPTPLRVDEGQALRELRLPKPAVNCNQESSTRMCDHPSAFPSRCFLP